VTRQNNGDRCHVLARDLSPLHVETALEFRSTDEETNLQRAWMRQAEQISQEQSHHAAWMRKYRGTEWNMLDSQGVSLGTAAHVAALNGLIRQHPQKSTAVTYKFSLAEFNVLDRIGRNAIFWAALNNHAAVCEELATLGVRVDPSTADHAGCMALHLAAARGNVSTVRVLVRALKNHYRVQSRQHWHIDLKAAIDTQYVGFTPLMLAALHGHSLVCRVLVEEGGADANAVCVHNGHRSVLHIAANGYEQSNRVQLNPELRHGMTEHNTNAAYLLYLQTGDGHCHTIETLVRLGAELYPQYIRTNNWFTALHDAAAVATVNAEVASKICFTLVRLGAPLDVRAHGEQLSPADQTGWGFGVRFDDGDEHDCVPPEYITKVPTDPQNTDYIRQLFSLVRSQVTADVYQKITVYVKKVEESTLANTDKRKKIMAGLIE
jgi:ankyrin repeat protein